MANVVVAGAYASEVVLIQRVFYQQNPPMKFQLLLASGSQVLGFSFGGLLRQFVVWPPSMIWPGALVNSALFNTLHKNYGKHERGHMSRGRFFLLVLAGCFIWEWVPSFLFTGLSLFSWVCWIAPKNVVVNSLFGTMTGLGMSVLTFDWAMISFIGSPLVTPVRWVVFVVVYKLNSFIVVVPDEHRNRFCLDILDNRPYSILYEHLELCVLPYLLGTPFRQRRYTVSGYKDPYGWCI